jgi:hypothetical protein
MSDGRAEPRTSGRGLFYVSRKMDKRIFKTYPYGKVYVWLYERFTGGTYGGMVIKLMKITPTFNYERISLKDKIPLRTPLVLYVEPSG